jgi:hypothetical protein
MHRRRNRRYLLIAAVLILGVVIGEVAVLLANWFAFAKIEMKIATTDFIRRDFGWDPLLDSKGSRMKRVRRFPPVTLASYSPSGNYQSGFL